MLFLWLCWQCLTSQIVPSIYGFLLLSVLPPSLPFFLPPSLPPRSLPVFFHSKSLGTADKGCQLAVTKRPRGKQTPLKTPQFAAVHMVTPGSHSADGLWVLRQE